MTRGRSKFNFNYSAKKLKLQFSASQVSHHKDIKDVAIMTQAKASVFFSFLASATIVLILLLFTLYYPPLLLFFAGILAGGFARGIRVERDLKEQLRVTKEKLRIERQRRRHSHGNGEFGRRSRDLSG